MSLTLFSSILLASSTPTLEVDGEGYLRLIREGRVVYARQVKLASVSGKLGTPEGATFLPSISLTGDISGVEVDLQGNVRASGIAIGRLLIAIFEPGQAVQPNGEFFTAQDRPKLVNPGDDLAGVIRTKASGTKPSVKPEGKPVVKASPKIEPKQTPKAPVIKPEATDTKEAEELVVPEPPAGGIAIALRARTVLDTPQFNLAQLGKVSGNPQLAGKARGIILGDTPPVGQERRFDYARILTKLRAVGVDPRLVRINMPEMIRVSRAGQTLGDDQFMETARAAIEEQFGASGSLILRQTQPSIQVPVGELKLVVDDLDALTNGYRVGISVYVAGSKVTRRVVTVDRVGGPAPVSAGQTVRVRIVAGAVSMETSGRVTKGSRNGEPVEIVTADGVKLTGVVVAPGVVEVRQ